MLPFQQVFDKVYDAHLSGKTAFFNVEIGDYMFKLLLAPGASPQTPPGGLFLPPGPPPPAWVDASHGHGLGHQKNSIQLLVPEPSLRPSSGSRGRLWNGLHDVNSNEPHCNAIMDFFNTLIHAISINGDGRTNRRVFGLAPKGLRKKAQCN